MFWASWPAWLSSIRWLNATACSNERAWLLSSNRAAWPELRGRLIRPRQAGVNTRRQQAEDEMRGETNHGKSPEITW